MSDPYTLQLSLGITVGVVVLLLITIFLLDAKRHREMMDAWENRIEKLSRINELLADNERIAKESAERWEKIGQAKEALEEIHEIAERSFDDEQGNPYITIVEMRDIAYKAI